MLRKTLFAVALLPITCLLLGSTAAVAGPFYVGASVGKTDLQVNDLGGSFSSSATTYKAFAGFRFMKFFGIEGGYVDFGSQEDSDAGTDLSVDATAWDAFAVGILPFGKHFEMFAKAGLFRWERSTDSSGAVADSSSDTGTNPVYGVGAAFKIMKHLAVRLEYEKFKMNDIDSLTQSSAGVDFRF
jgi:OOP family OmpA-OmpF porin